MYDETKTWNPFKGCYFNCIYCVPSFQRIAKRQKDRCMECYLYTPHEHPERLKKIPTAKIVFVMGNGDLYFAKPNYVYKIIETIKEHNKTHPDQVYYFQTKNPGILTLYLDRFPKNVILVTTLETNRDEGYEKISRAPKPRERFEDFKRLKWPRKVVTIEPVMDFDLEEFLKWIVEIDPEYVWIGYNSRPIEVQLPEPSPEKLREFIEALRKKGIKVKVKESRGLIA